MFGYGNNGVGAPAPAANNGSPYTFQYSQKPILQFKAAPLLIPTLQFGGDMPRFLANVPMFNHLTQVRLLIVFSLRRHLYDCILFQMNHLIL